MIFKFLRDLFPLQQGWGIVFHAEYAELYETRSDAKPRGKVTDGIALFCAFCGFCVRLPETAFLFCSQRFFV